MNHLCKIGIIFAFLFSASFSQTFAERGDVMYVKQNTYFTEFGGWKKVLLKEGYIVIEYQKDQDRIEVILTDRKFWWVESQSVSQISDFDVVEWNSWYISNSSWLYSKKNGDYSLVWLLWPDDAFLIRDILIDEAWYTKVELISWDFKWKIWYVPYWDIATSCVENEKYNILENHFDFSSAVLSYFTPYCNPMSNNVTSAWFQNTDSTNNSNIDPDTFDFSNIFETQTSNSQSNPNINPDTFDFSNIFETGNSIDTQNKLPQNSIQSQFNQWDANSNWDLEDFDFSSIFDL